MKTSWKYRTVVGMLSYLHDHTQPDISMPVHQTVCFSNDPKLVHEQGFTQIGGYLLGTTKKELDTRLTSPNDWNAMLLPTLQEDGISLILTM